MKNIIVTPNLYNNTKKTEHISFHHTRKNKSMTKTKNLFTKNYFFLLFIQQPEDYTQKLLHSYKI